MNTPSDGLQLLTWEEDSPSTPVKVYDKMLSISMIVIFSVEIVFHSIYSVRSVKNPVNRNAYNYIEYVSTFFCLLTHILYLVYTLIDQKDSIVYAQITLQNYVGFQLTFDLLNFSIIAKFFQWVEVSQTLSFTIRIMERRDELDNESEEQQRMLSNFAVGNKEYAVSKAKRSVKNPTSPLTPITSVDDSVIKEEAHENSMSKSSEKRKCTVKASSCSFGPNPFMFPQKSSSGTKTEQSSRVEETESFISWNTVDIEEDRTRQSRCTKKMLYLVILLNIVLSLSILGITIAATAKGSIDTKGTHWGFKTLRAAYWTISFVFSLLYCLMIVIFLIVFLRILHLFHKAYPDLFRIVKWRTIGFLFAYELFLVSRAFNYIFRQLNNPQTDDDGDKDFGDVLELGIQTEYYFSESILIAILIIVGFSNFRSEKETDVSEQFPDYQDVRKSFSAVGGHISVEDDGTLKQSVRNSLMARKRSRVISDGSNAMLIRSEVENGLINASRNSTNPMFSSQRSNLDKKMQGSYYELNRSSNPGTGGNAQIEQSSHTITNTQKEGFFYSDPKIGEERGLRSSARSNSINLKVECIEGELRDQIIMNNLKHSEAIATANQSSSNRAYNFVEVQPSSGSSEGQLLALPFEDQQQMTFQQEGRAHQSHYLGDQNTQFSNRFQTQLPGIHSSSVMLDEASRGPLRLPSGKMAQDYIQKPKPSDATSLFLHAMSQKPNFEDEEKSEHIGSEADSSEIIDISMRDSRGESIQERAAVLLQNHQPSPQLEGTIFNDSTVMRTPDPSNPVMNPKSISSDGNYLLQAALAQDPNAFDKSRDLQTDSIKSASRQPSLHSYTQDNFVQSQFKNLAGSAKKKNPRQRTETDSSRKFSLNSEAQEGGDSKDQIDPEHPTGHQANQGSQ